MAYFHFIFIAAHWLVLHGRTKAPEQRDYVAEKSAAFDPVAAPILILFSQNDNEIKILHRSVDSLPRFPNIRQQREREEKKFRHHARRARGDRLNDNAIDRAVHSMLLVLHWVPPLEATCESSWKWRLELSAS